jgi:hypothetical protein
METILRMNAIQFGVPKPRRPGGQETTADQQWMVSVPPEPGLETAKTNEAVVHPFHANSARENMVKVIALSNHPKS